MKIVPGFHLGELIDADDNDLNIGGELQVAGTAQQFGGTVDTTDLNVATGGLYNLNAAGTGYKLTADDVVRMGPGHTC